MTPEKKQRLVNDLFALVLILGLLLLLLRLWPLMLLLLVGLIGYAFYALIHVHQLPTERAPQLPVLLPPPATEQSVLRDAFGLLQDRITTAVVIRYPDARWIWSASNAFELFSEGRPLKILLNHAGGYQEAMVQVKDLMFAALVFPVQQEAKTDIAEERNTAEEESEENYEVLAFEWVEAHLQQLNAQSQEVLTKGSMEYLIPAEELPHSDSWPAVCAELKRSGAADAVPAAAGIQIKIKKED